MREIRRQRDIPQRYLAEKLGVSVQAVSNWERGVRMPRIEVARQIAELLAVPLDSIVFPAERRADCSGGRKS